MTQKTKMIRVTFYVHKGAAKTDLPNAARVRYSDDDYSRADAVIRSVARRTGYAVPGCTFQGYSLDSNGRIESSNYELTLGRYLGRGQGYSVIGSVWVVIPHV